MRTALTHAFAILLLSGCCGLRVAPEPPPPEPPPARVPPPSLAEPSFLEQYAATRAFRLGAPRSIRVVPGGDAVLYLRSGGRTFEQDLFAFDPATGAERVLLTADQILQGAEEQLTPEEKARRERQRETARGITSYDLSHDGEQILVPLAGRLYLVTRRTGAVREVPLAAEAAPPADPRLSPDARQLAFVRDGDVFVFDLAAGTERRLTQREGPEIRYGEAEFVAQEEMDRHHGYWWSPDGAWLAVQRTDTSGMEHLHLADPIAPAAATWAPAYPRPGQKNADVELLLIPTAGGAPTPVVWNRARYPYLATVRWDEAAPLTLLVQSRRQEEAVLLAADTKTGETRTLWTERDPAWVNLDQTVPRWVDEGSAYLWSSDREGVPRLELRAGDSTWARALTPPELHYQALLHVDEERHLVWFTASGPPPETHLYRVSLERGALPERVTQAPGLHSATFGRHTGRYVLIRDAPDETRRSATVIGDDGAALGALRSDAEEPPFSPRVELTTVEIEGRTHHAAIVRPRNFEAGVRYPGILYAYAGPGHPVVRASARSYLRDQWFADHGFIVLRLDGRGTPLRGRDWERAIKGDLIQVPLVDQAAGVQALAARLPELDAKRIGVYGWSFGGYFAAMATMQRSDVFKAGVAVAPVADWHDYDTHYTERYLGLPPENPEGYERSSVLTWAPWLEVPLLIMHGTVDDNVYFVHALKLSDALFRAGRDHAFLPLAGFTHMVADPLMTVRLYSRVASWFLEHLGDPELAPPAAPAGEPR